MIKENIKTRDKDLKRIALLVGTTDRRIRRSHSYFLGYNLYKYITQLRIDFAKALLTNTNLQAKKIGVVCGYDTAPRFTTNFKLHTGLTPSQYRSNLN